MEIVAREIRWKRDYGRAVLISQGVGHVKSEWSAVCYDQSEYFSEALEEWVTVYTHALGEVE